MDTESYIFKLETRIEGHSYFEQVKGGLFIYFLSKNGGYSIYIYLAELKRVAIWAARPNYTIYRKLATREFFVSNVM